MAQSNDFFTDPQNKVVHNLHKVTRQIPGTSVIIPSVSGKDCPSPWRTRAYIRRMSALRISKICHLRRLPAQSVHDSFFTASGSSPLVRLMFIELAPSTDSTQSGRKSVVDDSCIFQKRIDRYGNRRAAALVNICSLFYILIQDHIFS